MFSVQPHNTKIELAPKAKWNLRAKGTEDCIGYQSPVSFNDNETQGG